LKTKNPLHSPLLWGGLFSVAFYGAVHYGIIDHPLVIRYFAGHEVEYITTVMFFVGIASLLLKHLWIRQQQLLLKKTPLLQRISRRESIGAAEQHLETLREHDKKYGQSALSNRLRVALQFIQRCGSAEELDTELRYLADEDAAKADSDYGLVRLILWAMPMLGFLGTVIGITMALGNLDLNAINESSKLLSAGLMVAFDTTALAIALDVMLFFVQFIVYREENALLGETDKLTDNELRGRFESVLTADDDKQVLAVRMMLETTIRSLEEFTQRQAKYWEQSMQAVNKHFATITERHADDLTASITAALTMSLEHHAEKLTQAEMRHSDLLNANITGIQTLKNESVKQLETIHRVLGTAEQFARLEERLDKNLAAVSQTGNFEETVNSLAAAIHLLNGKYRFTDYEKKETAA
jgi:biopolymer transport protein ExbB/TolQ